MSKKIQYNKLISRFEVYKEKFTKDINDPFVMHFYDDFEQIIKDSNFSQEQLQGIKVQMEKLQVMFAQKKHSVLDEGANKILMRQQLGQYIMNSYKGKKD